MAKKASNEELNLTAPVKDEQKVDVFDRASGMFIKLPTSETRAFIAKAEVYGIKGRSGGPCVVKKKFQMPNGDIALEGDTFDPVEEKMDLPYYKSLVSGKFFDRADGEIETKLMKAWKKK